jgi:hypothetical protein
LDDYPLKAAQGLDGGGGGAAEGSSDECKTITPWRGHVVTNNSDVASQVELSPLRYVILIARTIESNPKVTTSSSHIGPFLVQGETWHEKEI